MLDVGLETFVTLSTGEKVKPPKFARKVEKKTARLARQLSRCEKGSKRREKAKARLARHHVKTANRRGDWLHKLSARIVLEHDTVCIEDLCIKGLMKTKLARSFADAALSAFLHQLEYKARFNGGQVVKVGRFYPSSKTCSCCGLRLACLPLSLRAWTCEGCGANHDRDLNAARNIKAEGLECLARLHPCFVGTRPCSKMIPTLVRLHTTAAAGILAQGTVLFVKSLRTIEGQRACRI